MSVDIRRPGDVSDEITSFFTFKLSHLSDTFVQSDLKKKGKIKVIVQRETLVYQ